ncbi:hypothetical protein PI23P_09970 [Polaribacter irgensii 23-P]|uniref:Uncharacterized protein n=1 Tax=Polaribacter irgensii 23-P TaxID=313594 RepID=A4C0K3_9FLAO|nr:hypothetical protein PI23P_09970 [Polaribacter irgensii 23-P]
MTDVSLVRKQWIGSGLMVCKKAPKNLFFNGSIWHN